MSKRLKLAAGVTALVFLLIFVGQNAQVVPIRFLVWEFALSRVVLVFVAFAAGLLIGWLVATWRRPPAR